MEKTDYLIIGAGITGLSFANFLPKSAQWLLLERCAEPGGYCRTITQDGFVWDYAGHFMHFRHPRIRQFLLGRMTDRDVLAIRKRSSIHYKGSRIDFPFQENIHQLHWDEFVECLHDLWRCRGNAEQAESFEAMVYAKYGRGIAEKFLIPYNEKLYACALSRLDRHAAGRFLTSVDVRDGIRKLRFPGDRSYNSTFYYPRGGAKEFVRALLCDLDATQISLGENLLEIDVLRKVARTNRRDIGYEELVSSIPFPRLLRAAKIPFDTKLYGWSKVLVFNLGFDRKGPIADHWVYFPERDKCFYRVGFYDNILQTDRMSLYVEIGLPSHAEVDAATWRTAVLHDLEACGIVTDQQLVSWHSTMLDPGYVYIDRRSQMDFSVKRRQLTAQGIHSIGRYGGWSYFSMEDSIVEACDLAERIFAEPGNASAQQEAKPGKGQSKP